MQRSMCVPLGRRIVVLASLAALTAACTGDAPRSPGGSGVSVTPIAEDVLVVGSNPGAPAACQPLGAANVVQRFLSAIAGGDESAIAALLGSDQRFRWYSASLDGRSYAAFSVPEASALLQRRAQAHEASRLLALKVQFDRRRGLGQLAYALSLTADDVRPASDGSDRLVEGKGAIHCASGTIIVWGMGTDGRGKTISDLPPYCSGGDGVGNVVIACASRHESSVGVKPSGDAGPSSIRQSPTTFGAFVRDRTRDSRLRVR
jgi:hypothetical protein